MGKIAGFAVAAALVLVAPGRALAERACADLARVALPHAQVTGVSTETVGGGAACRVEVVSRPTADSHIGIEVLIPVGAAWNGKFLQFGNGGFAGQIPSTWIAGLAARGYAVAATDDGHQSAQETDAAWALGHPEKIVDFGWRALKETTTTARALIGAMKGAGPARSYFAGCSDGGREALMEAQRFPADFDGIVAGAPAAAFTSLLAFAAQTEQALARPGGYLTAANLAVLQAGALKDCGGGGFIREPGACRFDPAQVQCAGGHDPSTCLTPAQVATARSLYRGLADPRTGKVVYPGYSPGAEAQPGAWGLWITGPSRDQAGSALIALFATGFFGDFAFADPAYDVLKLDLGEGFAKVQARLGPELDAVNPDLRAFRAHGGKLIQYHGWNDPALPARGSIVYYEDVRRTMGRVDDFYRLYLVPGMLHCGGGPGPGNVDWLSLLDRWVTAGAAPGAVVADTGGPGRPEPAGGPTQLLCPYPQAARRIPGAGAADAAAGWRCAAP